MDYLPSDPAILTSSINMLLRDGEYTDLAEVCRAFSRDENEILMLLHNAGYVYSQQQHQIRPIGYDE